MTEQIVQVIEEYLEKRERKKNLEEELKQTNKELTSLENTIINGMESLGLSSLKLRTGQTVGVRHRLLYDTPPKGSPEYQLALQWLKENGAEAIVSEQVNWQSLNAFLSDYLEHNSNEPPENLFKKRPELKLFVT